MKLSRYFELTTRIKAAWDKEVLNTVMQDMREELLDSGEYNEENVDVELDYLRQQCGK